MSLCSISRRCVKGRRHGFGKKLLLQGGVDGRESLRLVASWEFTQLLHSNGKLDFGQGWNLRGDNMTFCAALWSSKGCQIIFTLRNCNML